MIEIIPHLEMTTGEPLKVAVEQHDLFHLTQQKIAEITEKTRVTLCLLCWLLFNCLINLHRVGIEPTTQ